MSKIDELLKNEKVEWKKLGEIANISGAGVDKKVKSDEIPIKLLNYMDIYNNIYINKKIPSMEVTTNELKIKQCNIEYGDIFFTPSSETEDDIFMSSVAVEDFENAVYSYHIMRIRLKNKNFISSCYLNYFFRQFSFRKDMRKKVFGNTRKTIAKLEVEKLLVAIPPIDIQEKIVKTLDKFTNYVNELQTELQARNMQYSYYRDLLLSEEYLNKLSMKFEFTNFQVKCQNLDDITYISSGGDIPKESYSNVRTEKFNIPIISNGVGENAIYGFTDKAKINEDAVTISARGTIGYAQYRNYPFYPIVRLLSLVVKNKSNVNTKYLYYLMQDKKYNLPPTGIPQLTIPMLKKNKSNFTVN